MDDDCWWADLGTDWLVSNEFWSWDTDTDTDAVPESDSGIEARPERGRVRGGEDETVSGSDSDSDSSDTRNGIGPSTGRGRGTGTGTGTGTTIFMRCSSRLQARSSLRMRHPPIQSLFHLRCRAAQPLTAEKKRSNPVAEDSCFIDGQSIDTV